MAFSETDKLDIIRDAIRSHNLLEITYINEDEELQTSTVSPQTLQEENEEVVMRGQEMRVDSQISLHVDNILELSPSSIKQIRD